MDDAKQQLIDKLQNSNNILVTVSRNPSVDQLASCIGLTLLLNKQGKHAAAVFSGTVPSTLEFLQPEETLEKNTDSLRDFIISLDKAKADKLRYKVEDDVVRIFITPYKTSLSQDDLQFSEGDFNVDVVVALGVKQQEDLDQAITAHGRILHDATVTSINTTPDGALGTINWYDQQSSSLSELVTNLAQALGPEMLDEQIATALLTGIVAETERFSNDKTSSQTMSASAALMTAGANQQLVADKLEKGGSVSAAAPASAATDRAGDDGVLEIDHPVAPEAPETPEPEQPQPPAAPPEPAAVPAPEPPVLPAPPAPPALPAEEPPVGPTTTLTPGPKFVTEAPKMGGTLTANSEGEHLDPVTDPMSLPDSEPPQLLDRKQKAEDTPPPAPEPPQPELPDQGGTLTDLEKSVHSPHVTQPDLDTMRTEVDKALGSTGAAAGPIQALNAQPLGDDLHPSGQAAPTPPSPPKDDKKPDDSDPNAPPPVPPPIPFQFGNSPPPK